MKYDLGMFLTVFIRFNNIEYHIFKTDEPINKSRSASLQLKQKNNSVFMQLVFSSDLNHFESYRSGGRLTEGVV